MGAAEISKANNVEHFSTQDDTSTKFHTSLALATSLVTDQTVVASNVDAKVSPDSKSASALSGKGSAESAGAANKIGMTGFLGGVERVGITTVSGAVQTVPGLWHEVQREWEHPMEFVKTVATTAAIGSALRIALPEMGPVGKTANIAMTLLFLGESMPGFAGAYKTGLKANTWDDLLFKSGRQWGDSAGRMGVSLGEGYVGAKIGAATTGRILESERFDNFADWKQEKWDAGTDLAKRLLRRDTSIPTATSVSLKPNFVVQGDRAILIETAGEKAPRSLIGPNDADARMDATIMLKSRASALKMDRYLVRKAAGRAPTLTDENDAFTNQFGAKPESLEAVKTFAQEHNLNVEEADLRSGKVFLTGKTSDFQQAFKVEVNQYQDAQGVTHTGHDGPASVPARYADDIQAIFMDELPTAKSNRVLYKMGDDGKLLDGEGNPVRQANAGDLDANFIKQGGYLATEIARAQNIPLETGGKGQHGGFISLGGGIDLADYNKFFPDHNLEQPNPLKIVEVDGAKNSPDSQSGGVTEDVLDAVQMQSVAPKANIDMILGKNSDQGLVGVFVRGIFPRFGEAQKSVLSASWGLAEGSQTSQVVNTLALQFRMANIRGVQIFAGAGDNGARANTQFYQPEYPASDPNVTGVGGLRMILNQDGKLADVTAWDEGEHSSTGGGISKIFSMPWWQRKLNLPLNIDTNKPGRAVPDISTDAAKATGYPVRVNGQNYVIGGTSAGAPLYGGMMLNINAQLAAFGIRPVTPLNPWMYARANDKAIFHDVVTGGNHGYQAGNGWDAVTGLGWVDGSAMRDAMWANQTARVKTPLIPPFLLGNARSESSRNSKSETPVLH
ncbi:MAG TPA: S53 family peptidase [Oculatellaceae cyanobacterium]